MMKIFLSVLFCLVVNNIQAQSSTSPYNKSLADSLGADERGMKMFVLAVLKTGPNADVTPARRDSLMGGHMQFIGSMAGKGLLSFAGPLEKNEKQYRGIYIFNVKSIEEARNMALTDPSIQSGFFSLELYGLYGSAALPMLGAIHQSIQKKGF